MKPFPTQHVAQLAALMAREAFRLPRYEALVYLRDVSLAAESHSDAASYREASAIVRREVLAASVA